MRAEGRLDLVEQVLGVLLEPSVELAQYVSVALSAMWSPEPIARSPVSSRSEPSW